jgi:hypothetical protein
MEAFVQAVATGDGDGILCSPREALQAHLAAFAAERARRRGTVEVVPSASGP